MGRGTEINCGTWDFGRGRETNRGTWDRNKLRDRGASVVDRRSEINRGAWDGTTDYRTETNVVISNIMRRHALENTVTAGNVGGRRGRRRQREMMLRGPRPWH